MEAVMEGVQIERYPAYKDSGVEWLGEIPEHWHIKPGFTVVEERKEKNIGLKEKTVLSLSYGNVIVKPDEKLTGLVPESFDTYQLVYPGDIIIRPTDLQNDKTSLRTGLAKNKGIITSAYINLKVNKAYCYKFFHHFLHTIDLNKIIYGLGSGLRQNLDYGDFKRFHFLCPPIEEQTAIAAFLDRKTAQIDKAIAQKEALIELLKERRQILIHKAVTRGLDPNVRLKDSGVEWIGEIPEHWEVKRFGYSFNLSKGLTITKENLQDEGIPCVNYGEVHSKYGFEVDPALHSLKCVSTNYLVSDKASILKDGDFVFADTSEDIDGSGNFTYLNSDVTTFAGYHTIIARPALKLHSRFLAYEFDSLNFRSQIQKDVKGVKVFSISQNILRSTLIWLPNYDEQVFITIHLDKISRQINQAINIKRMEIERMREYKATLINAAVTGKIKVS